MLNFSGSTELEKEIKDLPETKIDLSDLTKGTYFLVIETQNGKFTSKIIKE